MTPVSTAKLKSTWTKLVLTSALVGLPLYFDKLLYTFFFQRQVILTTSQIFQKQVIRTTSQIFQKQVILTTSQIFRKQVILTTSQIFWKQAILTTSQRRNMLMGGTLKKQLSQMMMVSPNQNLDIYI